MITKVKINLTRREATQLQTDGLDFGFVKSDGSLNLGSFMNALIVELFKAYKIHNENLSKQIVFSLSKTAFRNGRVLTDARLSAFCGVSCWASSEPLDNPISFRPSSSFLEIYDEILNRASGYGSLSEYLRSIIMDYLSYPRAFRLYLILQEQFENAKKAFELSRCLQVREGTEKHILRPYYLGPDSDLSTLILAGLISEEGEPIAYKAFDFNNVARTCFSLPFFSDFNEEELRFLSDKTLTISKPKPQIDTTFSCDVKLDSTGVKLLKKIEQPLEIKPIIIDSFYRFSGSENDIFNALLSFGSHAFVVAPSSLKDRLLVHYKEAYESYDAGGLFLDF